MSGTKAGAPRGIAAVRPRPRLSTRARVLIAAAVALLVFDWSRPPAKQWTVRAELAAIGRYQAWISPLVARAGARCRFTPTCSHYAAAVLARDGALKGNARALWRVLRCAPWTQAGTVDPP